MFGTARTIERDHPAADHYWDAFRWQSDHVEAGRPITEPPDDPLTIITPDRIVYTEHWLRRSGYRPRHVLDLRPAGPTSRSESSSEASRGR
jgi:hypothetical protein